MTGLSQAVPRIFTEAVCGLPAPSDTRSTDPATRQALGVLISQLRWAGAVLSLSLTFFLQPAPISRPTALAVTFAIVLANIPAAAIRRLPAGMVEPILVLGLAVDFLAATAWLLLTRGQTEMTSLVYMVVAVEAAATYGWPGAAGFMIAFLGMLGARVWEMGALFGTSPPPGDFVGDSAVVLAVAAASGAIASRLGRLRYGLAAAGLALEEEQDHLRGEAIDRQKAEEALAVSEARLRTIVRNAPVVLLAIDRQGQITFCEGAGLAPLGRRPGQWVGWSVRELYADRPEILEHVRKALSGQTVQATVQEGDRTLAVSYGPSRDVRGELVGAVWVGVDITEQQKVATALREQTELHAALIRAQSDLGDLVIVSVGEKPIFINEAVAEITGYTKAELMAMPSVYDLVPDEDRPELVARLDRLRRAPGPYRFDAAIQHKSGRRIELEAAQLTVQAGATARTFTIARDVTARRLVEAEREALLSRLVRVEEDERRQIANDIHDDSIQTMFAVKIRLHLLRAEIRAERHLEMLDQLDRTIDAAITRLRRLLFDLRPVGLEQEGLAAALGVYLDQMRTQHGLEVELEASLAEEPDSDARTIVYRIAQEALANVRKHAQAKRVLVSLTSRDGGIQVRIRDDGRGFTVEDGEQPRPGHLGLAAMRERAEMAQGWLTVESTPGEGTEVEYWIPLSSTSAQPAA